MELGSHQWSLQIVHPDLCTPIADRHEDFGRLQVAVNGVDWAQVTIIGSISMSDFDGFAGFFIGDENCPLLSTDNVFCGLN